MRGTLSLSLGIRAGKTVVVDQYWRLPLQVMPPSYQDEDDQAFVYLLNPTGGIVQGDVLRTTVAVHPGARALITTPSSGRVYRMDSGRSADERYDFHVGAGAVLEYLPEPLIPHAGASLARRVRFDLERGAALTAVEVLAAGRVGRGERFEFRRLSSEVELRSEGSLKYLDRAVLEPGEHGFGALGAWEGASYLATLLVCGTQLSEERISGLAALLEGLTDVNASVSQPEPGLLVGRLLSETLTPLRDALFDAWNLLRLGLLGKPAIQLRRP